MINKQKIKGLTEKIGKALFDYSRVFLYTDIEDPKFKMRNYIRITAYGKLNYILKYPMYVPNAFKASVFNELQERYAELSGDNGISDRKDRIEKYNIMARKIRILQMCGHVLCMSTESEKHKAKLDEQKAKVIAFLAKSGVKGDDIVEKLMSEIENIQCRAEAIELSLKIETKDSDNKKVTEDDYSRMFMLLTKMGYPCSRNMSVIDYINALKLYKQEVKSNNEQIEKMKRHGRN